MWKWRTTGIKSKNISLPEPGRLLECIDVYPFDRNGIMQPGSYLLFLFSEKVCLNGPNWKNDQPIVLWLFHFYLHGERVYFRWYEDVPLPNNELGTVKFDWTKYWKYVNSEQL